jgi:endoglucanase
MTHLLLLVAALVTPMAAAAEPPTSAIRLDQVGYPTAAAKVAAVVGPGGAARFTVHRVGNGRRVFAGKLSAPIADDDSGDLVRLADFSALKARGRYELRVAGVGRSWPFEIAPTPYRAALRLTARSYYGQRCGTAVDLGPELPTYRYGACHLDGAFHASAGRGGAQPASGGWHDAGDYGRYVVNSGISTGTLLWTWELYGSRLARFELGIPESGDATPDLLDEVRWNLEWMLSMQDDDGGVWHKQTSEQFPGFIEPHADRTVSYVIGTGSSPFKSSCATGDFAAVMAIAGRVYRDFDPAFAERSLSAARRAWSWLAIHPNVVFRNPPGVGTGEYGDGNCSDERLWAAAELWRTARDEDAHRFFLDHAAQAEAAIGAASPPAWPQVGALAAWTYALDGRGDAARVAAIRQRSRAAADEIVSRSRAHAYRIPMTRADYIWGSNAVAANYGLQLLVADRLQPRREYVDTAREILHYLFGRNPFGLSWVTGLGADAVRNPHHRPSGADGNAAPWPGLLAGGPNQHRNDDALRALPADLPPAKVYIDHVDSYASNEVAINWNAPLVFLLAGLS